LGLAREAEAFAVLGLVAFGARAEEDDDEEDDDEEDDDDDDDDGSLRGS